MPSAWITLEDQVTACTQVRVHPAGGIELRTLAVADYAGYHVTLTVDQTERLREALIDSGIPPRVEALTLPIIRMWCEVNGYGLVRSNGPNGDEHATEAPIAFPSHGMQKVAPIALGVLPPSPQATILDAAIAYWEDRQHKSILTDTQSLRDIQKTLLLAEYPERLHYWAHADALHHALPELFPGPVPPMPTE